MACRQAPRLSIRWPAALEPVGIATRTAPHRRTVAASADGNAAVEEQRRLACVGMTRARTELHLSVPQVTGHGANQRETAPSSFLAQIADKLRTIAAPTAPRGEPPADVTTGPLGPECSL